MKTKVIPIVLLSCLFASTYSQSPALELAFTAIDSASYTQIDSIKVINRTQGGDTVLVWPDTVLFLDIQTGIQNKNIQYEGLKVFQNIPNPVKDQTTISLYIPDKGNVSIMISDILGRPLISAERVLETGKHSFRFIPGNGKLFIFNVGWNGSSKSIKIISAVPFQKGSGSLEYLGNKNFMSHLKSVSDKGDFVFNPGNKLLYIGYIDTLQSGILDVPETKEMFMLQFSYNMPCLGMPLINYEGQEYNTLQVFSQCWLKENLNVGTMIPGNQAMTNNAVIEKYCYNNLATKCVDWGGLYTWDEMMQYSATPGIQGICPPGWHIPSDDEIIVLEGAIDGQHGIGELEWDGWDFRSLDIGYWLKSISGWFYNGNGIDSHGFTLFPAGARFSDGSFIHSDNHAYIWSSNEEAGSYGWGRLIYTFNESCRNSYNQDYGLSVRCIRD